jgi:hypothetical protein
MYAALRYLAAAATIFLGEVDPLLRSVGAVSLGRNSLITRLLALYPQWLIRPKVL